MEDYKEYTVEVTSDFEHWERFNLYLVAATYSSNGEKTGYFSVKGCGAPLALQTPPCDHIEVLFYAIANAFPESRVVRTSPDFECRLLATADGEIVEDTTLKVNQWGGVTLPAYRIPNKL